jgi:DNA-binding SARP family transcriptional activator/WD40 repeat protein
MKSDYCHAVGYEVLGPVRVLAEGSELALGGPQQRLVLALLIAAGGRSVSTGQLIDGVWGEDPPASAKKTLQGYVHHLRAQVGDALQTETGGYSLQTDGDIDAAAFERTHREAAGLLDVDPARAGELLREALALWKGPAYADLRESQSLVPEVARLDDLRVVALGDRIDADLAMGRHAAVIGELEGLTYEHPLQERFRAQYMTALYRAGRQVEALRSYERFRRYLGEEMGLDPSPDLQRLEQQILINDEDLLGPDDSTDAVPTGVRGYELRELVASAGSSETYRGYQRSVGREVLVRVLGREIADDPEFISGFVPDTQRVAALEHPNIGIVYDTWREPGRAYQISRWFNGGTLADRNRSGNGGPSQFRALDQIGDALAHAHRSGVVHGDIRPSNVLFDDSGNAYLTDFVVGTGTPERDAEHDRHDFVVLAHELLAGRGPRRDNGRIAPDLDGADLPGGAVSVFGLAFSDEPYARIEDFLRALRRAVGVDSVAPAAVPELTEVRNPYKGLQAFQEADAEDFYGRDELVERLVDQVDRRRLVAVVGPSGSGKSSVVKAGVAPRLLAQEDGPVRLLTEMYPGGYPFEELERALLRVGVERSSVIDDLLGDERGLLRVLKQILPSDDAELVLVIDQFEELFSVVGDERTRQLFLDSLVAATSDPRSQLRVVVTMRADFFDRPLQYPGFGEVFEAGLVGVTMPDDEQLGLAISEPARSVGVEFDDGLVPQIVQDVSGQPGGLPLLQYALTELFEHRDSNRLTLAAYQQGGGVFGALGRRAEALYQDLDGAGRNAVREALLRMVTVDEGVDDLRRRVRRVELNTSATDDAALTSALQVFGAHRLLTFDRDPVTRGPTVEVAHEALLREWPRMTAWIDEQRDDLVTRKRLDGALNEWRQSGEDASFLPSGGRLAQFQEWAATTALSLSSDERQFLEAGVQREVDADRRRARIRRIGMVGLTSVAVVLAVLALFAFAQKQNADDNAAAAETSRIAAEAVSRADSDPQLALLLATEAHRRDPSAETLGALQRTMLRAGPFQAVTGHPDRSYLDVAWDGTGSLLVAAHIRGLEVYRAGTPEPIHSLDVSVRTDQYYRADEAAPRVAMDVTPDGTWAAVATANGDVALLDLVTGESDEIESDGGVVALAFSRDSRRLATGDGAGTVRVWSLDEQSVEMTIDAHSEGISVYEEELAEWGAPLDVMAEWGGIDRVGVAALTFAADDSLLVTGDQPTIRVWDSVTGERVNEFPAMWDDPSGLTPATAWPLDMHGFEVAGEDSPTLLAYGKDHLLTFDLSTGVELKEVDLPIAYITTTLAGADLMASGAPVVSLSDGRIVRPGDDAQPAQTHGLTRPGGVAVSPAGDVMAIAGDGAILLLALDDRTLLSDTVAAEPASNMVSISSSGDLVVESTTGWSSSGGFAVVHERMSSGSGTETVDLPTTGDARIHSVPAGGPALLGVQAFDDSFPTEPWQISLSDVRSGRPVLAGPVQYGWSYSQDGRWFAADSYGTVRVWDLQTGAAIAELDNLRGSEIRSVSFSADGSLLIATTHGGGHHMWETTTWRTSKTPTDLGKVLVAAFGPDGRHLATVDEDGEIAIRDADSMEVVDVLTGSGPPDALGGHLYWSNDGSLLVSLFEENGRLWDVETGQQIGDPFPNDPGIFAGAQTGDVPQLVTKVGDAIHTWNLDVDSWPDIACRAAGRNMTQAEWDQFGPTGEPYRANCPQYGTEPAPG